MIEFDIRLEKGGVQRVLNTLNKLKVGLEASMPNALKRVGEQYYNIVISRIGESQGGEMVFGDVYWKPLSDIWLDEKIRQGLVEEIWEATGDIKRNVRIFDVVKEANGWSIFVGLKGVGQDVMTKAMHNEFGATLADREIPARPLFEPARRELVYNPTEKNRVMDAFKNATKIAVNSIWKQ